MKIANLIVNVLFIVLFIGIAIALIKMPDFFGLEYDSASAATLCGAMLGGAALLFGNQINYMFQLSANATENKKQREALITILMSEIVSIFLEHARKAKHIGIMVDELQNNPHANISLDETYVVPTALVYEAMINNLLILKTSEVDAIVNLYDNLAKTRKAVNDVLSKLPQLRFLSASQLKNQFLNDCSNAAGVVGLIALNRKIQLPNGQLHLFTELLNNPTLL